MSGLTAETRRLRLRMRVLSLLADLDPDGVGDKALATALAHHLMPEVDAQIAAALTEAADDVLTEFDPPIEACIWASEWLRDRVARMSNP